MAWIVPGSTTREVIGGKALTAWQPDQQDVDDDSLPDAWQKSYDFDKKDAGLRGAPADIDGDGVSNWDEWKSGKNPLVADAINTEHLLRCETWLNLAGHRLKDLETDALYPTAPTVSKLIDNMDFSDEGEDYGCRLRGYITAPEDGSYIFYVSGNDSSLLYLADTSDKFTKRVIAQTSRGTEWRSFSGTASQESEPILLKKGNRYYIEVLFKRGARLDNNDATRDHASVAWKRPGRLQSVIDPEFFSPYQADPRDTDDDDLADEWERAHDLDVNSAVGAHGSWGDPDEDGLDNFREFQMGLDPHVADVHGTAGLALWEYWENVTGGLESFKAHPAFPLNPTERKWITRLEGPQNIGKFYGSRMRAYLIPPSTGEYTFALSGDNECELSLSASEDKITRQRIAHVTHFTAFREWDAEKEKQQRSQPVTLEAGKRYFIEILHTESTISDHVSAAWKIPGSDVFTIIDSKSLAAFAQDRNDLDDDDLPDDWERKNSSSTSLANGDKDNDGDGFTNREEYKLGTRADLADTDGDGVNDYEEIKLYGANPLESDCVAPQLASTVPLGQYHALAGAWSQTPNGSLLSMARRGAVDFSIQLETAGLYLLELQAIVRSSGGQAPSIPVIVRVDGLEIGHADVKSTGSKVRWLTSWLSAGTHTVTVDNRNLRTGLSLEISSLGLFLHEGEDFNGNATPDWLDKLFQKRNRLDTAGGTSATSPACIEGVARVPADVRITTATAEVQVQPGLAGRWFANVPLDPTGDTPFKASFENGSVREDHRIRWTATNLLSSPDLITLRVGDSLMLTAVPTDVDPNKVVAHFLRDNETLGEGTVEKPCIAAFDQPGTFTLTAQAVTGADSFTASVKIQVVAADFGAGFSLAAGAARLWDLPKIPHSVVIENDADLTLTEVKRAPDQSRRFSAAYAATKYGSPRVLARLWKDGPVVAATTVNAFYFAPASVTGNHQVINVLPDGTRVVEVRYVINGVIPKDLSIWLRFIVTDAIFEDGDTRHELTAADFDANGEARLLIYKAPGNGVPYVCHHIDPYQKDLIQE